jgi:hypothetical protein
MTIGSLRSQFNKWQWGIAFGKTPSWQRSHTWFIHVWFLNLQSLPKEGKMIRPENYRGYRWFKQWPLPTITIRTFEIGALRFHIPIKVQFY